MVGPVQRWVVLGELIGAGEPLGVEQLGRRASLETAAIRRTLGALREYGQVRLLLALDDGPALFVPAERPTVAYLRCPACGGVSAPAEHPLAPLARQLRERFGQELRLSRFVFAWRCARCAAGGEEGAEEISRSSGRIGLRAATRGGEDASGIG